MSFCSTLYQSFVAMQHLTVMFSHKTLVTYLNYVLLFPFQLELNWTMGFADPETEMEYDRQKEEFKNANQGKDEQMDFDEVSTCRCTSFESLQRSSRCHISK